MNKMLKKTSFDKVTKDTAALTVLALILKALEIFFNVKVSEKAGTAAVGIMSLIFSFFSCIMILANGNIFVSTSRFVSEESEGGGSIGQVMRYSLTFSVLLSGTFGIISFLLSDIVSADILKYQGLGTAIRVLSFSLMPAAVGSCIRGYFHGLRRIAVPMTGEAAEFIFKWLCMGIMLVFFPSANFFAATAASVCTGEVVSCLWYIYKYIKSRKYDIFPRAGTPVMKSGRMYMKMNMPIVLSGYVQMIMSAANEAIVPAALLKYSMSSEIALSRYGMFEAMIIPAIFFPSAAMASMSNIMIPEAAAAVKAGGQRPEELTRSSFRKAFGYSFFIAGIFLVFGQRIGNMICAEDGLVGQSLVILAPVIPFIYLEIILEGMLKGMGKQNFCTVNSLAEYIVRIGCVIIFVPVAGFYGIIISYYASNCISNIARIVTVCRTTGTKFDITDFILRPAFVSAVCCISGAATALLLPERESIASLAFRIATAIFVYWLMSLPKKNVPEKAGTI